VVSSGEVYSPQKYDSDKMFKHIHRNESAELWSSLSEYFDIPS
jgi:hypothetical protein